MSLITRLGSALLVLATVLPFAAATYGNGNKGENCKDNQFWYEAKSCCLPSGGPPAPPPPPKGHDCPPSSHYWNSDQGCCTPRNPPPPSNPPPQCRSGWFWYGNLHMCLPNNPTPPAPPPSSPSGGYGGGGHGGYGGGGHESGNGYKRHVHKRAAPLCPNGLDACPISGLSATDYECVDTAVELESCGGCASLGQGQDCTAIKGAWNVGCEQGRCAVYTCTFGFKRASDGQSCIPL
ncbi:protein priA [Mycena belliarum]|uniref:Protein priA n=1 Tax=Mycena belliarum TaxID=1033014 RepID=A0AAD6Y1V6_9AGAR|nr:protein priA [Mycena belliae]